MDFLVNKTCHLQYRIKTFEKSPFEKIRGKCNPKRMAEAGFYYVSDQPREINDLVRCYACGVELYGWNRGSDDPWSEHERENPGCLFLAKKKSYANELTVKEFLEIERYRYHRLNESQYTSLNNCIMEMIGKVQKKDDIEAHVVRLS